uniref:Uncharacterized protein n=1 Tax=Cannabis sativa TaxID=3483 RepID=A0A803PPR2_CANSA
MVCLRVTSYSIVMNGRVQIVALVVLASSKKSAASVTFVASASLVAFETVRLETFEGVVEAAVTAAIMVVVTTAEMKVEPAATVDAENPLAE